jgi:AbrB family looped-hinge helix DNA binding protein
MIMGEMKIGQKGQVVIPMMFRKAMNIVPGTKVIFERIAKAGKTVENIHPHEAYEGEIEERVKKMRR